ncbi:hypothetical protein ACFL6U_29845 [Planctomycetota bacterium]
MEVANVQLMELDVYDRTMDYALKTAYHDVCKSRMSGSRQSINGHIGSNDCTVYP